MLKKHGRGKYYFCIAAFPAYLYYKRVQSRRYETLRSNVDIDKLYKIKVNNILSYFPLFVVTVYDEYIYTNKTLRKLYYRYKYYTTENGKRKEKYINIYKTLRDMKSEERERKAKRGEEKENLQPYQYVIEKEQEGEQGQGQKKILDLRRKNKSPNGSIILLQDEEKNIFNKFYFYEYILEKSMKLGILSPALSFYILKNMSEYCVNINTKLYHQKPFRKEKKESIKDFFLGEWKNRITDWAKPLHEKGGKHKKLKKEKEGGITGNNIGNEKNRNIYEKYHLHKYIDFDFRKDDIFLEKTNEIKEEQNINIHFLYLLNQAYDNATRICVNTNTNIHLNFYLINILRYIGYKNYKDILENNYYLESNLSKSQRKSVIDFVESIWNHLFHSEFKKRNGFFFGKREAHTYITCQETTNENTTETTERDNYINRNIKTDIEIGKTNPTQHQTTSCEETNTVQDQKYKKKELKEKEITEKEKKEKEERQNHIENSKQVFYNIGKTEPVINIKEVSEKKEILKWFFPFWGTERKRDDSRIPSLDIKKHKKKEMEEQEEEEEREQEKREREQEKREREQEEEENSNEYTKNSNKENFPKVLRESIMEEYALNSFKMLNDLYLILYLRLVFECSLKLLSVKKNLDALERKKKFEENNKIIYLNTADSINDLKVNFLKRFKKKEKEDSSEKGKEYYIFPFFYKKWEDEKTRRKGTWDRNISISNLLNVNSDMKRKEPIEKEPLRKQQNNETILLNTDALSLDRRNVAKETDYNNDGIFSRYIIKKLQLYKVYDVCKKYYESIYEKCHDEIKTMTERNLQKIKNNAYYYIFHFDDILINTYYNILHQKNVEKVQKHLKETEEKKEDILKYKEMYNSMILNMNAIVDYIHTIDKNKNTNIIFSRYITYTNYKYNLLNDEENLYYINYIKRHLSCLNEYLGYSFSAMNSNNTTNISSQKRKQYNHIINEKKNISDDDDDDNNNNDNDNDVHSLNSSVHEDLKKKHFQKLLLSSENDLNLLLLIYSQRIKNCFYIFKYIYKKHNFNTNYNLTSFFFKLHFLMTPIKPQFNSTDWIFFLYNNSFCSFSFLYFLCSGYYLLCYLIYHFFTFPSLNYFTRLGFYTNLAFFQQLFENYKNHYL